MFQTALLCNASAIILAHNHPSGRLIPSKEDIKVTERMIAVGNIMEISVVDHIIVGLDEGGYSMKREGNVDFDKEYKLDESAAEH